MKDAYDNLFKKYNKDKFFADSLEAIIYIDTNKITSNWQETLKKLKNNEELFIRGFGRDAKGTNAFLTLYRYLFSNNKIRKDPTNNNEPTKIITNLTGLNKKLNSDNETQQRIQNYQVSHLFGKTKNPLLFTAAWNIAYIPKYIDPFTGHETQGSYSSEFKKLFDKKNFDKFHDFINEYNLFVRENISPNLDKALKITIKEFEDSEVNLQQFEAAARKELSEIK
jgi:hypothetical protein